MQAVLLSLAVRQRQRTQHRAALHLCTTVESGTGASSLRRARSTGWERRELGIPTRSSPPWIPEEVRVPAASWSRLMHSASRHCTWGLHNACDAPICRWLSERFSRNSHSAVGWPALDRTTRREWQTARHSTSRPTRDEATCTERCADLSARGGPERTLCRR